ncbi:hypothetical protein ACFWU5_28680 [Nocardia sp. NPDC058640]|uniref:hypothetical protein n=1 Tax=Nocardia sp. NPDC058640 TaxID=3346571 RepID=UPI00364CB6CA
MIGVAEVDGGGGAEVVLWHDGNKVWGIQADDGETYISGDVPAEILAKVEEYASEENGEDDPDYFNAILNLGGELTGYDCGNGFSESGPKPFEILDDPDVAAVLNGFPAALAAALAGKGFTASPSLDGYRTWYTAATSVPGLTAAVAIRIHRANFGGVTITGSVGIQSAAVAEVLSELPETARLASSSTDAEFGEIDDCRFDPERQLAYPVSHSMVAARDIGDGVDWVMKYLDGPMATWFAERSDVTGLVSRAKTTNVVRGQQNVNPRRLRATIAFCAAHGHHDAAADLAQWYLARTESHPIDSTSRASAFDAALREQFPEYARARYQQAERASGGPTSAM